MSSGNDMFEITRTPDKGNGLAAKSIIKKGTVIMKESLALSAVVESKVALVCSHCLNPAVKFALKKCGNCKTLHYCSEKCQRKDWPLHKSECVLITKIGTAGPPLLRLTARCLTKCKDDPVFLNTIKSLESNEDKIVGDERRHIARLVIVLSDFLPRVSLEGLAPPDYSRLACILRVNSFILIDEFGQDRCLGFFLGPSRINHSCRPNAESTYYGRNMRIIAMNDIQEGEELTISYINRFQPLKARQETLQQQFYFRCNCPECKFETKNPADHTMELILNKELPLKSRLQILNSLIGKRNLLFAYYLSELQAELVPKNLAGDLKEAKQIMDMLINPENEIVVDINDTAMQRDIYGICCDCELAQHPEGTTRRFLDLDARRNRLITFLKGTENK